MLNTTLLTIQAQSKAIINKLFNQNRLIQNQIVKFADY